MKILSTLTLPVTQTTCNSTISVYLAKIQSPENFNPTFPTVDTVNPVTTLDQDPTQLLPPKTPPFAKKTSTSTSPTSSLTNSSILSSPTLLSARKTATFTSVLLKSSKKQTNLTYQKPFK